MTLCRRRRSTIRWVHTDGLRTVAGRDATKHTRSIANELTTKGLYRWVAAGVARISLSENRKNKKRGYFFRTAKTICTLTLFPLILVIAKSGPGYRLRNIVHVIKYYMGERRKIFRAVFKNTTIVVLFYIIVNLSHTPRIIIKYIYIYEIFGDFRPSSSLRLSPLNTNWQLVLNLFTIVFYILFRQTTLTLLRQVSLITVISKIVDITFFFSQ